MATCCAFSITGDEAHKDVILPIPSELASQLYSNHFIKCICIMCPLTFLNNVFGLYFTLLFKGLRSERFLHIFEKGFLCSPRLLLF